MSIQLDLLFERGVSYHEAYIYMDDKKEPVDVSGYEAVMEISEDGLDAELILDLDSGLSYIEGETGLVEIFFSKEDVDSIGWRTGHYQLYFVTNIGNTIPFLRGTITIK